LQKFDFYFSITKNLDAKLSFFNSIPLGFDNKISVSKHDLRYSYSNSWSRWPISCISRRFKSSSF